MPSQFLSNLMQDLKFGVRSFLRAPRFSARRLALALGLGELGTFASPRVMLKRSPPPNPFDFSAMGDQRAPSGTAQRDGAANVVGVERNKSFSHVGMVGTARLSLLLDGRTRNLGRRLQLGSLPALGYPGDRRPYNRRGLQGTT